MICSAGSSNPSNPAADGPEPPSVSLYARKASKSSHFLTPVNTGVGQPKNM